MPAIAAAVGIAITASVVVVPLLVSLTSTAAAPLSAIADR